ncbi:uncharacterized protein TNCT_208921 [Trichonephila clavata]|uniref:Uncharacterized protein n=1 Tax=Trichonephila clavata TaxID=2740835 RepID=A0A8X6FK34_TRICU|nr:uncharacterized protein TNCT_208921 [Trichonephila clavata]
MYKIYFTHSHTESLILQRSAFFLLVAVILMTISSCDGGALDAQATSDSAVDLLPLESANDETIMRRKTKIADATVEDAISFKNGKRQKKSSPRYKIKMQNITDEKYNFLQWYSTPEDVKHHVDGSNTNDTQDLNAQSTSHADGYSHDPDSHEYHHDHHYYHGDDHPHHEDHHYDPEPNPPSSYSYHHRGTSDVSAEPESSDFGKIKKKKVKKPCSRSKSKKKADRWPERADTIVHGISKNGPEISHYSSNTGHSSDIHSSDIHPSDVHSSDVHSSDIHSPSVHSSDIHSSDVHSAGHHSPSIHSSGIHSSSFYSTGSIPKEREGGFIPMFPPMSFSAEHLHGIPKTEVSVHKSKGDENHFHLHNHHHYNPEGKKFSAEDPTQTYNKLFQSLGKLRSMLPAMLSGVTSAFPHLNQGDSTTAPRKGPVLNSDVKFAEPGEKKGYHYTGPHKSYGKKTYIRMNNQNSATNSPTSSSYENLYEGDQSEPGYHDSNIDVHDMGADMFKHGVGQYGTDEYRDTKGRFPNEVSLEVDKIYPGIGFDNHPADAPQQGYNPGSGESYGSNQDYPVNFDSNQSKEPEDEKYSPDYYERAPYRPYEQIEGEKSKPYEGNYGIRQNSEYGSGPHSYNGQVPSHSYDAHENDKGPSDLPRDSSLEGHGPIGPPDVTSHTVSFSQDGGLEADPHLLAPEKEIFSNLRPDPDPLSIPRNARIIEHFIRLDPVHFMAPRVPMEYTPDGGFKPQIPATGYPNSQDQSNGYAGPPVQSTDYANPPAHGDGYSNHPVPNTGYGSHSESYTSHPVPSGGYGNPPVPNGGYGSHPVPSTGYASHQAPRTVYPSHHVPRARYPPQNYGHIPLHKLMPNPLKMPYPVVPRVPVHRNPHVNQVLHAYQSRSFYHKWW